MEAERGSRRHGPFERLLENQVGGLGGEPLQGGVGDQGGAALDRDCGLLALNNLNFPFMCIVG